MKDSKLKGLVLNASPAKMASTIDLGVTLTADEKVQTVSHIQELFSAAIPSLGLDVPGILKIGATIAYEVGLENTFSGTGTLSAGLSATLPDDAKLVANINTPDQSSAIGFDTASATPKFDVTALSASVTVAAFAQPKLILGIVLTDIGAFDVNIAIKTPIVSATFTAAYSELESPILIFLG